MRSLGEFARERARRFGEKTLFLYGDTAMSYRAYDEHTDRLARGLAELGLAAGDRVAVLLPNGLEIVETYTAAAKLGAVSVPLNPMFTPREIEYVVNNSGARVFVTSTRDAGRVLTLRDRLPSLRQILVVGDESPGAVQYARVAAAPPLSSFPAVSGDAVAMILYTSGTTGNPKGAMLTHAGLLDNARAVVEAVGFRESDRSLCVLPLFHLFAIAFDFLQMMTAGASTVIVERFDAEVTLRAIERHRVSVMVGVPTMFIYLLQHPARRNHDLSSLRIGDTGGGPVPSALKVQYQREIGMTLLESYGLTEASPVVTIERPGLPRREGACGITLPGMETRVVDNKGQDMPPGELGELLVRGPNVMKGYFQMPQATAETIIDGWLHTGDLVQGRRRLCLHGRPAQAHDHLRRLQHLPQGDRERPARPPGRARVRRRGPARCRQGRDPQSVHRAQAGRPSDGVGDQGVLPAIAGGVQGPAARRVHGEPAEDGDREEPLQVRMARATRTAAGLAQPLAEPAQLRPRPGAQGHSALHGGANDAGERRGRLGERILWASALFSALETAAAQEPPHPSPNRAEHLRRLGVARPTRRVEHQPPGRGPNEHPVEGQRVAGTAT